MAVKKITDKHKLACYVLNKEFNRSQQKIADLFDVKQSTVSQAIKEAGYVVKLKETQKELEEVRAELKETLQIEDSPKLFSEDEAIIDI